jgi:Tol biopolymer transport system component
MRTLAGFACIGILAASTVGSAGRHDDRRLPGHGRTFGPWSRPVSLGPVLNSTDHEQNPAISRDGLSLYFSSTRTGSQGFDIWVSHRLAVDLPWETPVNLGPTVNTPANDNGPNLSPDGRYLFFSSNRTGPGSSGLADLYMSRRIPSDAGDVWDVPVPLSSLNTPGIDAAPNYFENEHGRPQLYFTTTRLGGPEEIHVSELQRDGLWGPPVPVFELNSPAPDGRSTIRRDGLEIIFDSGRDAATQTDLYASHRDHVWEPWSIPEKVGGAINTDGFDARPSMSHDGRTLYFTFQTAEGHLDLLVSTRAVMHGKHGKH